MLIVPKTAGRDDTWWDPVIGAGTQFDDASDRGDLTTYERGWGLAPLSSDTAAALADAAWLEEQYRTADLSEYRGKHIAVVDRMIQDSDANPSELRARVAKQLDVSPNRVVISFV